MGLGVPIVNAPMGGAAGGQLAAAVSAAGGLGMIGMGSGGRPGPLAAELAALGDARPFGIGLVSWVARDHPGLLETALAAAPQLLCVSFGDDWSWVARAHDAGIPAATQVADTDLDGPAPGARRSARPLQGGDLLSDRRGIVVRSLRRSLRIHRESPECPRETLFLRQQAAVLCLCKGLDADPERTYLPSKCSVQRFLGNDARALIRLSPRALPPSLRGIRSCLVRRGEA